MPDAVPCFELPDRPRELADAPVAGWREPVAIQTYAPCPPSRYPAYLHRRVYQGSSGRVYPLPFHERIESTPRSREWGAFHLDNAYVRLMIIPELGGRIHVGFDKTSGYDFFFRNQVIKPALVGLTGPWIAGGVEFNWPQHHRPATYLPAESMIETGPDGSVTVWCSDHDPFTRMKGMHGICLRPDSSLIELKVRLYNRSDEPQTFLWWANAAPQASADYQSFFPTDVRTVADHARRATTTFPHASDVYYGVDYPSRVDGEDRLDWYRNIPVPTSYMALGSTGDFFGGYDHGRQAGFVHVADHTIAVGKKQWTWGESDFGRAWCRNLTDDDSTYIELMAGVFTDNQPDFSHLAPGETKVFSQYWFPITEIGPVHQASVDGALRVERNRDGLSLTLVPTRVLADATVVITDDRRTEQFRLSTEPGRSASLEMPGPWSDELEIRVLEGNDELLAWSSTGAPSAWPGRAAMPPPPPEQVGSVEELCTIGRHLEQYRHATRSPKPYWQEALNRDPDHAATSTALGWRRYRDGRYAEAEQLVRTAVAASTRWNANPADTEAFYLLGLVLARTGRGDEAYEVFGRAAWTRAWRAAAGFQLAVLDARAGRDRRGLLHLDDVLRCEPDHLQAASLRVVLLRRLGRDAEAEAILQATRTVDGLHAWSRHLAGEPFSCDAQTCLDVALEYRRVGELEAALAVLGTAWDREAEPVVGFPAARPLIDLYRAEISSQLGRETEAQQARRRADAGPADRCFPGRLDDADLLGREIERRPRQARPRALLGTWLYAHDRPSDAIEQWQAAVDSDAEDPVSWRNLGLARHNHEHDLAAALRCYDRALALAPGDGGLVYERDQLDRRAAAAPESRLQRYADHLDAVAERDDAAIERAHLLITVGRLDDATRLLQQRQFQPWEGGEGQALRVWDRLCLTQAHRCLSTDQPDAAAGWVGRALDPPDSLAEKRHPLANSAVLHLVLGDALRDQGDHEGAERAWTEAADQVGDFLAMSTTPYSESTAASALACRRLGRDATALEVGLREFVDDLETTTPGIDYFATSLPTMLLFTADLRAEQDIRVDYLRAQLDLLAGDSEAAQRRRAVILERDPSHAEAADLDQLAYLAGLPGWRAAAAR